MSEETGKWVRGTDVHPLTNIFNRKWRVVHPDGSVTTGTFRDDTNSPHSRFNDQQIEWFFPEERA